MAIHTITCQMLKCDGCDQTVEFDDVIPHHEDGQILRKQAVEAYEWRTDGTSDWCPDCQWKHHTCAADPADPIRCVRCGNELDEDDAIPTEES